MGAVQGKEQRLLFRCFELLAVLACMATIDILRKEKKTLLNTEIGITQ